MKTGETANIKIEDLIVGGDGLGRLDGKVIFVPYAAPEEHLVICFTSVCHDYAKAKIINIIKPSSSRISPLCQAFGDCGGCQWQHLNYPQQLLAKTELVRQALIREGKITEFHMQPIIPSPEQFHYRHRMQFSVNHKNRTPHIGLYKKKTHDLIEMETCSLAHPLINKFLLHMREVLSQYDNKYIQGIDITVDDQGKSILPVFHFKRGHEENSKLFENLKNRMPEAVGALIKIEEYKKPKIIPIGQQEILYPTVGHDLYIGPETFIQVNREGNKILVQAVLDLITDTVSKNSKLLEMHCGTGNFSLPLANLVGELTGVENNSASVALAKKSMQKYNITNCSFYEKSDLKAMKFFHRFDHRFDILLVDPPRCGCKEILEYVPKLGIQQIIYVSCSLPTLARDLHILSQLGFKVDVIQPIDMFPQTHHVECVTRLIKKSKPM